MIKGSSGGSAPKPIKVSQRTIDDIKRLGMTQALKLAGANAGAEQSGEVAAFAEGVRRMYGERRYQAAINKPMDSSKASNSPYGFNGVGTPTRGDGSTTRAAADKTSSARKNTRYTPGSIMDNIANNRGIFGNVK